MPTTTRVAPTLDAAVADFLSLAISHAQSALGHRVLGDRAMVADEIDEALKAVESARDALIVDCNGDPRPARLEAWNLSKERAEFLATAPRPSREIRRPLDVTDRFEAVDL